MFNFRKDKKKVKAEIITDDNNDNPIDKSPRQFESFPADDKGVIKIRLAKDDMRVEKDLAKPGGVTDVMDGIDTSAGAGALSLSGQLRLQQESVPESLAMWYSSQTFIGYQLCSILAQHWLVDKACSQSCSDALRNGWKIQSEFGKQLTTKDIKRIKKLDRDLKIKQNLYELGRFTNIFGIRVMIFKVKSDDPFYYTKPFNIDSVTPGSYQGMSQVDPYWMTPVLTTESMADPSAIHFYEPEYWLINGIKYHRSHLCITRGPQPADILKPTYYYGGISLTQRIYERVYNAERTANEAPLLAMNKRTNILHVDLDKVALNENKFMQRMHKWRFYIDNWAVKLLGLEDTYEQVDTSLTDFDDVIMNQYQLVASIAGTPAAKLLETSPKGWNSTGEFETVSYHEKLESIQEDWYQDPLDRHYEISMKSLQIDNEVHAVFNPVDSMSSKSRADINNKVVADIAQLITVGSISPLEGRDRLASDEHSGWNNLSRDESQTSSISGLSPANISNISKAESQLVRSNALSKEVDAGNTNAIHKNLNRDSSEIMDEEEDEESLYSSAFKGNSDLEEKLDKLTELVAQMAKVMVKNNGENPVESEKSEPGLKPVKAISKRTKRIPPAVKGMRGE